jgi:hypothetical protein
MIRKPRNLSTALLALTAANNRVAVLQKDKAYLVGQQTEHLATIRDMRETIATQQTRISDLTIERDMHLKAKHAAEAVIRQQDEHIKLIERALIKLTVCTLVNPDKDISHG